MPPVVPPSTLFILPADYEQPQAQRPGTCHQLPEDTDTCHSLDGEPTQLTAGEHPDPAE